MGQSVIAAATADPAFTIAATHDGGEDLDAALADAEVAVDFTLPIFTAELLDAARRHRCALVIGTTGHTQVQKDLIRIAAEKIPIVFAPNFSVGVNTLFWLARRAAGVLRQDQFDIEVVEMHHKHKIDAPSGTAARLLEILTEETGVSLDADIAHGRRGDVGPRPSREIGMHTLRGGDVVGDHTVIFAADGERIELTHKASSRMTFALGALRAAQWLRGRSSGLYDMQEVLGLH